MPKPKQHQEKADHNKAFLVTIVDDQFCDWKATVAFYAAVHLVEKLRAFDGEHSQNHDERDRLIRRNFSSIYNSYHQLFNASLIGRYKSVGAFNISADDVQKILIDTYLEDIEKFVAKETISRSTPPTAET